MAERRSSGRKRSGRTSSSSSRASYHNNAPYRRLYRSRKDVIIAGVCGGIAEYFEVDPTAVRLLWILITLITGIAPAIIVYLIAWIIVPEER